MAGSHRKLCCMEMSSRFGRVVLAHAHDMHHLTGVSTFPLSTSHWSFNYRCTKYYVTRDISTSLKCANMPRLADHPHELATWPRCTLAR